MGSKQAATKRAPTHKRVTGQRKAKKKEDDTVSAPAKPRPKPRPRPTIKDSGPPVDVIPEEPEEQDDLEDLYDETNEVSLHEIVANLPAKHAADDLEYNVEDDKDDAKDFEDDEEDQLEDSDADEDTSRPVIDITFEVPYKNASRDLIIKSNASFAKFLSLAAQRMETSVLHLSQIGYVLPWKAPKSGKPIAKLLEDEKAFQKVIEHVWAYIDEQKGKNRGKGKVKPFSVQIIDTTEAASAAPKGGGKKSARPTPPPNPPDAKESEHQFMTLLEKKHACEEHGGRACYVQANGMHYQYTMEDLTIWSTLLSRHLATIDTPPDKLNLTDKCIQQAQIKKRGSSQPPTGVPTSTPVETAVPSTSSSDPPVWAQMMMMMMGGAFANNMGNQDPRRSSRTGYRSSPSPPLKRPATDSATTYPDLKQWLKTVEENPARNKHREKFTEYADTLVITHKLFTIEDLVALTNVELANIGSMEFGTASRILRFAREDAAMLERHKKQHVESY